jgi:biotin carboxyl carrier protein
MQEVVFGEKSYKVEPSKKEGFVIINNDEKKVDVIQVAPNTYHLLVDSQSVTIEVADADSANPEFVVNGKPYKPTVKTETDLLLERLGLNIKAKKVLKELRAPMPGLVLEFRVSPGDVVNEGDALVVLEAMKMENQILAPRDGIIESVSVEVGTTVAAGTVVAELVQGEGS